MRVQYTSCKKWSLRDHMRIVVLRNEPIAVCWCGYSVVISYNGLIKTYYWSTSRKYNTHVTIFWMRYMVPSSNFQTISFYSLWPSWQYDKNIDNEVYCIFIEYLNHLVLPKCSIAFQVLMDSPLNKMSKKLDK